MTATARTTPWTWRPGAPLRWRIREDGAVRLHDPARDAEIGVSPWTRALFEAIEDEASPEELIARALSHPDAPDERRVKRFLLALEKAGHLAIEVPLPERLGGLAVERELGRGGAGIAYLCRDGDRAVVAKVPWDFLHSIDAAARAVAAEADVLAKLDHPRIARLVGLLPGPLLLRELVDGTDLVSLHQGRPASAAAAAEHARAIAEVLAHVAERGFVLVDLKPSNFLVGRDGLRLIDAGHARAPGATRVGGTPGFLPPEARAKGPASSAWDVWGLGRLYAFLRTGALPDLRQEDDPLVGLPDDARAFVGSLCARDPLARPKSIHDAIALLP